VFDVRCPLHGCWAVPFSLEYLSGATPRTATRFDCACATRGKRRFGRRQHQPKTFD